MRYRHEQMIRERERRRAPSRLVEAALWQSLTAGEQRIWRSYSDAVARVRPR